MVTDKRVAALDFARITGVLGVLGIHLLYPIFSRYDFLGGKSWWGATIIHTFSLVSVPLLIMVSGYLMVGRNISFTILFKKVWFRLLLPLIFWTSWYIWWNCRYNFGRFTFSKIATMTAEGSCFHLYFLIILIGLYTLLPLINRLLVSATSQEKRYGFMLVWIMGFGVSTIYYLSIVNGAVMNTFTWWLPYLGYFLVGYVMRGAFEWHTSRIRIVGLFWIWFIFTLFMSYEGVQMLQWNMRFLWHSTGTYYFNTFLSPNVIIMSVSLFYLLITWKSLQKLPVRLVFILSQLSLLTYGVYLIHFSVMDWVDIKYRFAIEFVTTNLKGYLVYRSILVIILSFVIAWLLRQLPLLHYIVGEPLRIKLNRPKVKPNN